MCIIIIVKISIDIWRLHELGKVLIIGAGGVASVVVHKCCQVPEVFEEICLASRTIEKCEAIKEKLLGCKTKIQIAQLNADNTQMVIDLIRSFGPDVVINVALPYQDLTIMDACLATGVHYVDTANYEPIDIPKFEYKWQWAYKERFEKAGITALLGSGFDPGVTGVFCAYAQKHIFDEINYIDIVDANAGDHGYPFATNFNPEINIREITANGRYLKDGDWIETEPLSMHKVYDFPEIGEKNIYLLYHEELESLSVNIKGIKQIRFWMTFSDNYLNHLHVLENVGITSIKPIMYEGKQIVPLQFLKALLPDPATLGVRTKGKTNIGCIIQGIKDGVQKTYYVYNVCVHEECYAEVGSQAVSYTTGVPAMIGAMLILKGIWKKPGVYNVEEFDPDPFMEALNKYGLPWQESLSPTLID
jgi:saccharopine dehydrogenase (NAD+, L-lysine-forming)